MTVNAQPASGIKAVISQELQGAAARAADPNAVGSLVSGRGRSNCTAQRPLVAQNPCHTCLCAVEFPYTSSACKRCHTSALGTVICSICMQRSSRPGRAMSWLRALARSVVMLWP